MSGRTVQPRNAAIIVAAVWFLFVPVPLAVIVVLMSYQVIP